MATLRKEGNLPFTQVPNKLLNDKNISWKAKALFCYLFSKPDGWDFSAKRIAKDGDGGYRRVLTGLKELEENSYLDRTKKHTGRMEYFLKWSKSGQISTPNAQNRNLRKPQPAETGTISNKDSISNKDDKETIIDFFFQKKGWKEQPEPVKSRYKKPAKELLEMASLEEIKKKINIVSTWAESRDLNWTLSTVIKKWGEIDSLKEKKEKKKPYFRGEPMTKKGDQWYVMPKDGGQWQEFAGKEENITWK